MKIYFLLSFDHELPLGGISGTFSEAVFNPTEQLLNSAKELKVPVNLFTDVLSGIRLKQLGYEEDYYKPYVLQLQKAIKENHDVQLHLHPHWFETTMVEKNFHHTGKFALSDFINNDSVGGIEGIIKTGKDFLYEVCSKADPHYKCIAYRAGGFNLSPATPQILGGLYNQGIRIESSIVPGLFYKSDFSVVDFRVTPRKSRWYISPKGPLSTESDSGLLEVSIAAIPAGIKTNVKHIINKSLHKERGYSSGKTIHAGKVKIMDKLKFVFSVRMLGFDVFTMTSDDLMKILNYNVKRYSKEEVIMLSSVSHPKNMGKYSLTLMKEFVEKARTKYGADIEFITYRDAYKIMKLS